MLWNASEEYGNDCEEDKSTDGEDEDSHTDW